MGPSLETKTIMNHGFRSIGIAILRLLLGTLGVFPVTVALAAASRPCANITSEETIPAECKRPEIVRLCYMSFNNEKEFQLVHKAVSILEETLNKAGRPVRNPIQVLELVEKNGRPERIFTWLQREGLQCHGFVISGHHTSSFGGARTSMRVSIDDFENYSCSSQSRTFFNSINSLWLQGCRTLGEETEAQHRDRDNVTFHAERVARALDADGLIEQNHLSLQAGFAQIFDTENPYSTRINRAFPNALTFGWTMSAPGVQAKSERSLFYHLHNFVMNLEEKKRGGQAALLPLPDQPGYGPDAAERLHNGLVRLLKNDHGCPECATTGWLQHGGKVKAANRMSFGNPYLSSLMPIAGSNDKLLTKAKDIDCQLRTSDSPDLIANVIKEALQTPALSDYVFNSIRAMLANLNSSTSTARIKKALRENKNFVYLIYRKLINPKVALPRKIEYYRLYADINLKRYPEVEKEIVTSAKAFIISPNSTEDHYAVAAKRDLIRTLTDNDLVDRKTPPTWIKDSSDPVFAVALLESYTRDELDPAVFIKILPLLLTRPQNSYVATAALVAWIDQDRFGSTAKDRFDLAGITHAEWTRFVEKAIGYLPATDPQSRINTGVFASALRLADLPLTKKSLGLEKILKISAGQFQDAERFGRLRYLLERLCMNEPDSKVVAVDKSLWDGICEPAISRALTPKLAEQFRISFGIFNPEKTFSSMSVFSEVVRQEKSAERLAKYLPAIMSSKLDKDQALALLAAEYAEVAISDFYSGDPKNRSERIRFNKQRNARANEFFVSIAPSLKSAALIASLLMRIRNTLWFQYEPGVDTSLEPTLSALTRQLLKHSFSPQAKTVDLPHLAGSIFEFEISDDLKIAAYRHLLSEDFRRASLATAKWRPTRPGSSSPLDDYFLFWKMPPPRSAALRVAVAKVAYDLIGRHSRFVELALFPLGDRFSDGVNHLKTKEIVLGILQSSVWRELYAKAAKEKNDDTMENLFQLSSEAFWSSDAMDSAETSKVLLQVFTPLVRQPDLAALRLKLIWSLDRTIAPKEWHNDVAALVTDLRLTLQEISAFTQAACRSDVLQSRYCLTFAKRYLADLQKADAKTTRELRLSLRRLTVETPVLRSLSAQALKAAATDANAVRELRDDAIRLYRSTNEPDYAAFLNRALEPTSNANKDALSAIESARLVEDVLSQTQSELPLSASDRFFRFAAAISTDSSPKRLQPMFNAIFDHEKFDHKDARAKALYVETMRAMINLNLGVLPSDWRERTLETLVSIWIQESDTVPDSFVTNVLIQMNRAALPPAATARLATRIFAHTQSIRQRFPGPEILEVVQDTVLRLSDLFIQIEPNVTYIPVLTAMANSSLIRERPNPRARCHFGMSDLTLDYEGSRDPQGDLLLALARHQYFNDQKIEAGIESVVQTIRSVCQESALFHTLAAIEKRSPRFTLSIKSIDALLPDLETQTNRAHILKHALARGDQRHRQMAEDLWTRLQDTSSNGHKTIDANQAQYILATAFVENGYDQQLALKIADGRMRYLNRADLKGSGDLIVKLIEVIARRHGLNHPLYKQMLNTMMSKTRPDGHENDFAWAARLAAAIGMMRNKTPGDFKALLRAPIEVRPKTMQHHFPWLNATASEIQQILPTIAETAAKIEGAPVASLYADFAIIAAQYKLHGLERQFHAQVEAALRAKR